MVQSSLRASGGLGLLQALGLRKRGPPRILTQAISPLTIVIIVRGPLLVECPKKKLPLLKSNPGCTGDRESWRKGHSFE